MNQEFLISKIGKYTSVLSVASAITLSFSSFAIAADPFRVDNARDIGEHTEEAFNTLFVLGDYFGSLEPLKIAEVEEPNEPLAYTLRASLAFTEEDWETLNTYAQKTLEVAEKLEKTDPLRGNLYLAVGHFLDGAYIYEKDGPLGAIQKLQLVFKYFDAAEVADPNDPELNLIKGYMDLLLAVNLPFSSPEQAITRFKTYAAPNYLVNRGIAVAYRDLENYETALKFADKALEIAPDNPEHYYLKGQILKNMGKQQNSIPILERALDYFSRAIKQESQLPKFIVKPLKRELNQTNKRIAKIKAETANK
ncbi:tetratricopeptide repeat protein [Xenococcus sp. PCC 7305]|uniref:Sll0314/Alr1548 family TPR repeat-containing protein n=1 Tax=Xenococcus sp. PCC 7305 TaxID=102125 RepID=UPI0002ACFF40|nr:Sll0314/Alr1548 family TPR repeat-containing protein [Xenococcus sp. PCC 7305]ELS03765.1 tetratricopeptide repeat protein [Xenococcus sp. PCC 7305]